MKQVNWQRVFAIAITALIVGVLTTFTFSRAQEFTGAQYANLFASELDGVITTCPGKTANDPAIGCFIMVESNAYARMRIDRLLERFDDITIITAWTFTDDGIGRFRLFTRETDLVGLLVNDNPAGGTIVAVVVTGE